MYFAQSGVRIIEPVSNYPTGRVHSAENHLSGERWGSIDQSLDFLLAEDDWKFAFSFD